LKHLYYLVYYHHRRNETARFHVTGHTKFDAEMQVQQYLGTIDWRLKTSQHLCLTNDTVFLKE